MNTTTDVIDTNEGSEYRAGLFENLMKRITSKSTFTYKIIVN
jgi:hypothetical protein